MRMGVSLVMPRFMLIPMPMPIPSERGVEGVRADDEDVVVDEDEVEMDVEGDSDDSDRVDKVELEDEEVVEVDALEMWRCSGLVGRWADSGCRWGCGACVLGCVAPAAVAVVDIERRCEARAPVCAAEVSTSCGRSELAVRVMSAVQPSLSSFKTASCSASSAAVSLPLDAQSSVAPAAQVHPPAAPSSMGKHHSTAPRRTGP